MLMGFVLSRLLSGEIQNSRFKIQPLTKNSKFQIQNSNVLFRIFTSKLSYIGFFTFHF